MDNDDIEERVLELVDTMTPLALASRIVELEIALNKLRIDHEQD